MRDGMGGIAAMGGRGRGERGGMMQWEESAPVEEMNECDAAEGGGGQTRKRERDGGRKGDKSERCPFVPFEILPGAQTNPYSTLPCLALPCPALPVRLQVLSLGLLL